MTEQEIARLGDEYRAAVVRTFGFLVDEFGFEPPVDVGSQYRHSLAYRCPGRHVAVVFANAFHPVDYGFEIDLYPSEGPWRVADRDMVFHVLKEDQDRDFQFLARGVAALRQALANAGVR